MRHPLRRLGAITVVAIALLCLTSTAHAGDWVQISCVNPDGSAAPSQGWTASSSGSGNASASSNCGPNDPMNEFIDSGTAGGSQASDLHYDPPSGSTLAGGTLTISGYANGSSPNTSVTNLVFAPAEAYPNDVVFACIGGNTSEPCMQGNWAYTNTAVTIPDSGGTIDVSVGCSGGSSYSCSGSTNSSGYVGQMELSSAQIVLSNQSTPAGSGFSGTLTNADVSGTADLLFTATDSSGPGVYEVTADIDGSQVYSGTPNTESGECVPVGTDASAGNALEFDYAQPCPQSVSVDVPINTTALSDGTHQLSVSVIDAAGNTATVYSQNIAVDNASASSSTSTPTTTPAPTVTQGGVTKVRVRVQFLAKFRYIGSDTRFDKITHTKLPKGAKVVLSDRGPHRPKLKLVSATGKRVDTLLKDLTKVRFSAGDKLTFTVTAPGEVTERIQVTFHRHRKPTEKLL